MKGHTMDTSTKRVLKSIRNNTPSKLLLSNPLNKKIIHTNGAYYYIDRHNKYQILAGLLPSLKKCFWPTANIKTIMKTPKKTKTKTKTQPKPKKGGFFKSRGRFYGSIKGTSVHEELEDFILLDKKNFLKKHQGLHPWSKRILKHITEVMNWTPLKSEFHVYDEALRIGTSIDMICVDNDTGKLILLEFKTGYKTYFENNDGYMDNSLCLMKNSPLNWATIQLVFSTIILMKQQETRHASGRISLKDVEAYVIRIDDDTLDSYSIDNVFIKSMTKSLYQDMFNIRNQ